MHSFSLKITLFQKVMSVRLVSSSNNSALCERLDENLSFKCLLTSKIVFNIAVHTELPTLPDSAESCLKINQSFHGLINTFENPPDCGHLFPIMLHVFSTNLPDCKMQMLAALHMVCAAEFTAGCLLNTNSYL